MKKQLKTIIFYTFFTFLTLPFCTLSFGSECSADLKSRLEKIDKDNPFLDFTLGLSEEEKKTITKIKINSEGIKPYDNFGNLNKLTSEVSVFLESLGNSKELSSSATNIIERIVHDVKTAFDTETVWITIRLFTKSTLFDMPRWHTDGYYYSPFEGNQYKVALTLKGPGTLFLKLPSEVRKLFMETQYEMTPENSDEMRKKLIRLLEKYSIDKSLIHQGKAYSGTVFIVGNSDNAAIHSEPPINSERLFVSILPGSKKQIQELYNKWHPKLG